MKCSQLEQALLDEGLPRPEGLEAHVATCERCSALAHAHRDALRLRGAQPAQVRRRPIVALAGISTAVVLYPVLRKQNESAALGLVAARILESGTIFVGVAFLLSIVTLRQASSGADALVTGHALAVLYDRIFLLGQSFIPAICDLLLGFMLYISRLVPKGLAVIGMAGAVPLVAGYVAMLFGVIGQHSALAGLSAVLVALFEFSLGIYLLLKGFRPSAITANK